jgi:N-acetylglutamate synthase-like GNAT family acetyltransferase
VQLRAGTTQDTSSIRALLAAEDLPTADLSRSSPQFIVAFDDANTIVAAGALETHGDSALLRSVVVARAVRGTGLGQRVVQELERIARIAQVKQLALLTQSARQFFERQGYRVIARQAAPEVLQQTEEFRSLCPVSAICMAKFLAEA